MRFTDWWRLRYGESSRPESTYLERDLKQWACLAWIQGFEEGRKRAVEERSDTSQGGGSQEASTKAQNATWLEGIIKHYGSYPEWHDKHIHPVGSESHQNWKVELYLPIPLSETDKSFEAALRRWAAHVLEGVQQPGAPRCSFPCHGYEPCKCRAGGA